MRVVAVPAALVRVVRAAAAFAFTGVVGCAHHPVTVTSNVDGAHVRVDGVDRGVVHEGAHVGFDEEFSDDHVYDIEVRAPGYKIGRVQAKPNLVDWRFAPAMVAATTGTCLTSCMSPFVLYTLADYSANPDTIFSVEDGDKRSQIEVSRDFAVSWAVIGSIYGGTALAWWFVANAQTLPDEIHVKLDRDQNVVEVGDLPPPPAPAEQP